MPDRVYRMKFIVLDDHAAGTPGAAVCIAQREIAAEIGYWAR